MKTIVEYAKNANEFSLIDPASGWARRNEFMIATSKKGYYTGTYGRGEKSYVSCLSPEQLNKTTFINACLLPTEDRANAGKKVYKNPGEVARILSTRAFVKGEVKNDHNTYYALSKTEDGKGYVLEETSIVL